MPSESELSIQCHQNDLWLKKDKKNSGRVGSWNLSGLERHGIVDTKFVGMTKLGFRLSKRTNNSQFSPDGLPTKWSNA